MRVHTLVRDQELPGPPEEVFGLFADARNLEAITPPLLRFEVVTPGEIEMRVGTLITYALRLHGVPDLLADVHPGVGPAAPLRRPAGPRAVRVLASHP